MDRSRKSDHAMGESRESEHAMDKSHESSYAMDESRESSYAMDESRESGRVVDGYRDVWGRADGTTRILVVAVAIAIVQTLAVFLVSLSILPHVLAVPLAVLLGPAAAWGVALGAVFYEFAAGGLGVYALVLFLDVFVCAVIGRELWNSLPNATLRRPVTAVLSIVPVALVATLLGLGLALVLSLVLAGVGFTTVGPALVVERLLLAAILAPVILAVGYLWRPPEWDERETPLARWAGTILVATGITIAWVMGTAVLNLIRRDAQMFPAVGDAITGAIPPPVDAIFAFMLGPHGWVFYLIGAIVALLCVSLVLRVGLSWSQPARNTVERNEL